MRHAAILFLLMLLAAPARAQDIMAEPFQPEKVTSFIAEFDNKDETESVQLQGDALVYKKTKAGKEIESSTTHPTDDDWLAFIQSINNNSKVYKWADKYYYPGQGPSWVIDLDMADRKFNSAGTNEYPLQGDETKPQANPKSGPSVPFQLFWQAVLKLAGEAPAPKP